MISASYIVYVASLTYLFIYGMALEFGILAVVAIWVVVQVFLMLAAKVTMGVMARSKDATWSPSETLIFYNSLPVKLIIPALILLVIRIW